MLNLDEIYRKLKGNKDFRHRINDIGDLLQYSIPGFSLLTLALVGDPNAAWLWVYGAVLTTILTQAGKVGFNYTWLGERPDGGDKSMPSGHTSSAFFGAWYIAIYWGLLWGAVPLLLACLVAFSRVFSNAHHVRDVIAGALLAGVCTYLPFIYNGFW